MMTLHDALLLLDLPNETKQEEEVISAAHVLTKSNRTKKVKICDYCQCTETPMWRHGPKGYKDLCNKVIVV
jgi:hypothetical protein